MAHWDQLWQVGVQIMDDAKVLLKVQNGEADGIVLEVCQGLVLTRFSRSPY